MNVSYRHADGLEALDLNDETVILHMESSNFFTLNETAAAIWAGLAEPATSEQVAAELASHFEGVSLDTAQRDVKEVIAQLIENQLITTDE